MAFESPQMRHTGITASADLSAKQFYFVKFSGEKTVDVCSATTDIPCGVLQNNPKSGEEATVCFIGITKLVGNAGLTATNIVGTANNGKAAAYAAGTDTTKYLVGQVIGGTSNANELATVYINCFPGRGA